MGTSYQLPEVTSVEVPLLVAFAYTWEYRLVSFPSASYILVIFNSPFIVITRGDAAYAGSDSSMASNSTSGIIRFFKEMTPFICFTS